MTDKDSTQSFSIVLAGGGVRGFAHLGVLRALEQEGLVPDAVVGVSMGAVVGTTYALREDWYSALLDVDTSMFPRTSLPRREGSTNYWHWFVDVFRYVRLILSFTLGWGVGERILSKMIDTLSNLTQGKNLEDGRIPVAVCATDLRSGSRVTMDDGPASEAVLASASLAGMVPPRQQGDRVLVDGAYADIAPVDVARRFDPPQVLVVDPSQPLASKTVRNGLQAILRAVEICQMRHADLRFNEADKVIRPPFKRTIDTMDFSARRECVAAGIQAVRNQRQEIHNLLRD